MVQRNCVDKLPLQSVTMDDAEAAMSVTVLCFGPLKDAYGRTHQIAVTGPVSCQFLINKLGAAKWINKGLKVAINGAFCGIDSILYPGDELALLPPVSGG